MLLAGGHDEDRPSAVRVGEARWSQLVPGVRGGHPPKFKYEIGVCLTVTVIAALAAFDIVYVSTGGGPGNATAVPGIQIYSKAFLERQVGLASALAVIMILLVLPSSFRSSA